MSAPRLILPGRTYLLSRRCTQRCFLLRPDDKTNEIFRYCLAEAARKTGIRLIAWVAMSNHYHAVVHDPGGTLPAFLERFHKLCAKALNVRWSRWENLWATEQTSVVRLVDLADIIDKVIYVLANPVAAHLVDRATAWPGESAVRQLDGRPVPARRPRLFFRDVGGRMPASASLVAELPMDWTDGREAWIDRIRAGIAEREAAAQREREQKGTRIVGRKAVLAMSAFDRPETMEPRRNLKPAIAAKSKRSRIEALRELIDFRRRYATALAALMGGDRGVVFPRGTYRWRLLGLRTELLHPAPA